LVVDFDSVAIATVGQHAVFNSWNLAR